MIDRSPSPARRRRRGACALVAAASMLLTACGVADVSVVTERADAIPDVAGAPVDPADPDEPEAPEAPTPTSEPSGNEPIEPVDPMLDDEGGADAPVIDPSMIDPEAIDFGDGKPEQPWDDFLTVALADVEVWLSEEFEPAFGLPFEPLTGGIFAAFPSRTEPIPGCGTATSSFEDIRAGGAIYCFLGDFIAYDDTDEGVIGSLANEFGPVTFGLVLAHEYGHALQQRTGALQRRDLATVDLEQQADCVAGAWAGRANAGGAAGIDFDDRDVRAGLVSMISIEDPIGVNPTSPGGHGSGFDRVGAFQVGFQEGLGRCATLLDDPLPLTPVLFNPADPEGNAPFGFAEDQLFGFLVDDLNLLYDADLDAEFPQFRPLDLVAVDDESGIECRSPTGYAPLGMELCSESDTVYLVEPLARDLYDRFGDFGPAYLIGLAWAEHAQNSEGGELRGESRQLRNDCLTGAWVGTVIPLLDENGFPQVDDEGRIELPQPRDEGRTAVVSDGDLTEAVLTAIVIGDPVDDRDVLGSAFEKVESFRTGTLGGFLACG